MRRYALVLLPTFVLACDDGPDAPPPPPPPLEVVLSVSPAEGSVNGGFPVTVTADSPVFFTLDPADISIQLGDNRLINLEKISDTEIRGVAQGHAVPARQEGPFAVDVTLTVPAGTAVEDDLFQYLPPNEAIFSNVFAVGASFTAGIQSNSFNQDGQQASPVSALARHVGAFLPTAFVQGAGIPPEPGFAELEPATGLVNVGQDDVLEVILDAVNASGGTLAGIRADPALFPHNLAIPGTGVRHILNGTDPTDQEDLGFFFIELLLQDPNAEVFSALAGGETALRPPIDIMEEAKPSLIWSTVDFFGNDVLGQADIPTSEIRADLFSLLDRVSKIEGNPPFFTLTLIDVNVTPVTGFAQDERYEVLNANQAVFDAAEAANAALEAQGLPPRLFVGDFFSPFFELLEANPGDTIDIAGLTGEVVVGANGENEIEVIDADGDVQIVGLDLFEGIFSFDALHLTEAGYAVVANSLIILMNESIGPNAEDPRNRLLTAEIPLIDVAAILARDPLAPKNLEAARQAFNETALIPFPALASFADAGPLLPLQPWDRCAITVGPFAAGPGDDCPTEIVVSAPNSAAPGQEISITVEVNDQDGQRMRDLPVSFFIDRNDGVTGSVQGEEGVFTNAQGEAQTSYTAGTGPGPVEIQIQAGGLIVKHTVTIQ